MAIRFFSAAVGAFGRSGTEASLGNSLPTPGFFFGGLALSATLDSVSSPPEIASTAPSYHSTGFAQSGIDEQALSSASTEARLAARANLESSFCINRLVLFGFISCKPLFLRPLMPTPASAQLLRQLLCNAIFYTKIHSTCGTTDRKFMTLTRSKRMQIIPYVTKHNKGSRDGHRYERNRRLRAFRNVDKDR